MPANGHTPRHRLRRGDLSDAARRRHARALLDARPRRRAVRLPGHPQRVDLDRRLLHACATAARSCYRPTCHYAYHPCDDAVLSLHEMFGRAGKRQEKHRTSSTRTRSSTASTNSACCSTATPRTPIGTARSSRSRRRGELAPYQNATGLQVTSAVLAGMVWVLENPERRHRRGRRDGFPPLPGGAAALSRPGDRALHRLDAARRAVPGCFRRTSTRSDPWQFRNVLVTS